MTGRTRRELRNTREKRKRGLTVITLIKKADFMLKTSREHKEAPEQRVVRRVMLSQTHWTVT